MAFTKTPEQSTYQTKRIRLVKEIDNRGTNSTKDVDYVNVYPELIKNRTTKEDEIILVKRDGSTQFIASVAAASVRGLFFWESQNQLFVAVEDDIRIYNATSAALLTTLTAALASSSATHVGFTEYLYDNGTVKVVATDGTNLMTIDSAGTKVLCVDADLPVHKPYPVFLDGYLFVIKAGTADLYNSNLNDPLLWTAGDFISAEMLPDQAERLSRLNNYLVVLGNGSIEYFWNAAVATGSPLQRNDTPVKLAGYLGGLATLGNKVFIIGSQNESQPDVFILEDFKMTPVGNEAVRRHLASLTIGTDFHLIEAAVISRNGHDFYVFHDGAACYSMDIETKLWSRWAWQASSNFQLENAVNANTGGGYKTFFSLTGDSVIYRFDSSLYQDNGTTFSAIIVTDNEDFDTMRQKVMNRLVLWADSPGSSSTGTLQWSDNDYQSFSTGVTINLNDERPSVNRLGRFRQRAFKFTYTQNQPLRLEAFEVDINMGQH